jgi:hypothetical protein
MKLKEKQTCIQNIYTLYIYYNCVLLTLETGVIPLGISDHNLVYICRKISLPKELPKIVLSRQYKSTM